MFGRVVATYRVSPQADNRSRFVVKLAFKTSAGLYGSLLRNVLPVGDLVMMRKQLLTLKKLAEQDARREA